MWNQLGLATLTSSPVGTVKPRVCSHSSGHRRNSGNASLGDGTIADAAADDVTPTTSAANGSDKCGSSGAPATPAATAPITHTS